MPPAPRGSLWARPGAFLNVDALHNAYEDFGEVREVSVFSHGSPHHLSILSLSYSEHLGATGWTYALSGWFAVLHGYALGVLHLFLGSAFNAVGFHFFTPFRFCIVKPFALQNPLRWKDKEKILKYGKILDLLIKKH